MHYVYILQSEHDQSFYTGMTSDLERRLREHNAGLTKYTSGHGPWKIVYKEQCETLEEARKRELFWKSGAGRERRNALFQ